MTDCRRLAADSLLLPAGRAELCLDFANTLCWRGSPAPEETLSGLPDLLRWLTRTAGVPASLTAEPAGWADADPAGAAQLFAAAITLREAMVRLFGAIATATPVAADDLAVLNAALADAPPRRHLVPHADGFAWHAEQAAPAAPLLLAPVLWSAADLLAAGSEHRVRRCANEKCQWLFIDRSKAGTRRWCDMAACGNRAKAQRHYARSKAEGAG